jgi:hypothetical protein
MTEDAMSASSTASAFDSPRFVRPICRRIMGRLRILAFPGVPILVVVLIAISLFLVMAMPPDSGSLP